MVNRKQEDICGFGVPGGQAATISKGLHARDVSAASSKPAPELNKVGVACVKNFRDMRS